MLVCGGKIEQLAEVGLRHILRAVLCPGLQGCGLRTHGQGRRILFQVAFFILQPRSAPARIIAADIITNTRFSHQILLASHPETPAPIAAILGRLRRRDFLQHFFSRLSRAHLLETI
jgi:hypothetical protein